MHVPHMAGLDLNLALVLHALLSERSVSRAAKRLGLSQSATSHALARLRSTLGDPLVVRSARGVVPTARAEAIAGPLAAGLALLERSLLAPPRFEPATSTRRFRIASTDYAEFLLLPRFLSELVSAAPQLELWIRPVSDDSLGALQRSDVDLTIGIAGPPPGVVNVQSGHLLDERLVCVVREGHALARGGLTLARYAAASHVLIAPGGLPGGPVDDALATRGLRRRVAVAVPHFLAAPHIVAETDLVLTVASRIAASFASVLPLRILELPFELPTVRVTMLWRERDHDDPAHVWFRERLAAVAAQAQAPRPWRGRESPRAPRRPARRRKRR